MKERASQSQSQSAAIADEKQNASDFASTVTTLLALLSIVLSVNAPEPNPIPLMVGAILLLVNIWWPASIYPVYSLWNAFLLGLLKTVTALFWFFYVFPTGLIMQARGIDPLNRKFIAESKTYWQAPLSSSGMKKSI